MTETVHPGTGETLRRGVRPLTLVYRGKSVTFDIPGWYCEGPDTGVFEGEDMTVSDRALRRLKTRTEGVLEPEKIRREQR